MILGIDTGGTFTDFVLLMDGRIRIHKVLSTPEAPERAILAGIRDLGVEAAVTQGRARIIHGTTIATNAALQRRGVPTAYITNSGLTDTLSIGRQTRPDLYGLEFTAEPPPVSADHCLAVTARMDAAGNEIQALQDTEIAALREAVAATGVEAVAINLLFSFLDDRHERRIAAALDDLAFVSRSSEVLPEYREYERGIATWLNAWLGPLVSRYLARLDNATGRTSLAVMQSSGVTIAANQAASRAVNLLLSGPAGGVTAAAFIGRQTGRCRLLTFDMGGTSTDVALVDGAPSLGTEGRIGPWPLAVPSLDIHTIGAGGGSIAHLDEGGMLRVGPASAGASPGPACYGLGGVQPTVTDANVVLGRLRPDHFLGGRMRLDERAAHAAVAGLAERAGLAPSAMAEGIVQVANQHMSGALRVISINKGHDPRDFQLCCFGGAGGLHVCALADALQVDGILLPANAGVFSALGMPAAAPGREVSVTHRTLLREAMGDQVETLYAQLEEQGRSELVAEGIAASEIRTDRFADLRYAGQSHALTVPWRGVTPTGDDFEALHEQRYGHRLSGEPVELVTLRATLHASAALESLPTAPARPVAEPVSSATLAGIKGPVAVHQRDLLGARAEIRGPALIIEETATTWVAPGWTAAVDDWENLRMTRN